ncbi:hypothetical protein ACM66B_002463 [Microbotryomycetes sp. NB124-2]
MLGVVSAIGGTVQVIKTLYEFYDQHKRNKAVLDILDGFTHNLSISIERLKVREQLLIGKDNPALDSIEKDFVNAGKWLQANDKNLRSVWTTLQACDKLKDLDDRLNKAFVSKFSVALFMSLQDVRQSTAKIETKLDDMSTSIENLEDVCREATRSGLQEAIKELKQEAWAVAGAGQGKERGFTGGEAEKIISALVDRLSEQDRIKEEEERTGIAVNSGPTPAYEPSVGSASSIMRSVSPYSARSSTPTVAYRSNLRRALTSRSASAFLPEVESSITHLERSSSVSSNRAWTMTSDEQSVETDLTSIREGAHSLKFPPGHVAIHTQDPIDQRDMIDPVLASDGMIYDRWSLIEKSDKFSEAEESLVIIGDVVQLREAIYVEFPERRSEANDKRQRYREETLEMYARSSLAQRPELVNRLSHCVLFEPTSQMLRIRRAIVMYRSRDFEAAFKDLEHVLRSTHDGGGGSQVELEALRIRALVNYEMNHPKSALLDCSRLLSQSPNDVLVLSLRSCLRTAQGDLRGAQLDLAHGNRVVSSETAFKSNLGQDDLDLEFVCRGWAYANIRDYEAAARDFDYAQSLKPDPDPYLSACLASAQVQKEVSSGDLSTPILVKALSALDSILTGLSAYAKALATDPGGNSTVVDSESTLLSVRKKWASSAEKPVVLKREGQFWTTEAYPVLFMRGSALYHMNDFESALRDFELGLVLRPSCVQDTGSFRALLAELRIENGQRQQADHDWLFAIALDPESKFSYESKRQEYGL